MLRLRRSGAEFKRFFSSKTRSEGLFYAARRVGLKKIKREKIFLILTGHTVKKVDYGFHVQALNNLLVLAIKKNCSNDWWSMAPNAKRCEEKGSEVAEGPKTGDSAGALKENHVDKESGQQKSQSSFKKRSSSEALIKRYFVQPTEEYLLQFHFEFQPTDCIISQS